MTQPGAAAECQRRWGYSPIAYFGASATGLSYHVGYWYGTGDGPVRRVMGIGSTFEEAFHAADRQAGGRA